MKVNSNTYSLNYILYLNKATVAICFLLVLFSSPIITFSVSLDDSKYELVDVSEKETSSKKETVSENEKEPVIISLINDYSFYEEIENQPTFFVIQPSFLNYKLDIQLPPPRV